MGYVYLTNRNPKVRAASTLNHGLLAGSPQDSTLPCSLRWEISNTVYKHQKKAFPLPPWAIHPMQSSGPVIPSEDALC